MRTYLVLVAFVCYLRGSGAEETRLLDLEPNDAQNIIEQQDQTLKYAPKIESDVPAVRFLGQEPHNVLEDIYLAKQYHGQDGLGGYLYGYQVPDIAKNEQKKPSGDLRGAYNYVNGAGQEIKVEYWDNGTGFHQVDNIPQILPQQIEESPEVKAAKESFLKRWHEEAERNSHPIANPYNSEGQYAAGPLSVQGQQRASFFTQQKPSQYQRAATGPQNVYAQQQKPNQYQGAASGRQNVYAQQPQPQQATLYQAAATGQKEVYAQQPQQPTQYQAAATGQQNVYAQQPGQPQTQQQDNEGAYAADDEGKYVPQEGEESTGPPKGFFYAFDYPVGIITHDQGRALQVEKSGNLNSVYQENKQRFERQLQQGGAPSGGSQYLIN